jgi:hypothetical protein
VFHRTLGRAYLDFITELPSIAKTTEQEFLKASEPECFATFPLIDVLPDAGAAVSALIIPFLSHSVEQLGLFSELCKQLNWNLHAATRSEQRKSDSGVVMPNQHKGEPREIVAPYLHNTP